GRRGAPCAHVGRRSAASRAEAPLSGARTAPFPLARRERALRPAELNPRRRGAFPKRGFPRIGARMKAICWHGKGDVRVDAVPDPRIEDPRDVVVKVTATAICGSDLHLYDGFVPGM